MNFNYVLYNVRLRQELGNLAQLLERFSMAQTPYLFFHAFQAPSSISRLIFSRAYLPLTPLNSYPKLSNIAFLKDGTRKLSKLVFIAPLSSYVKHQDCTIRQTTIQASTVYIHIYICTILSTYYDTFPNHLVRLNISPNNFQTLLQRIETRDINPVFTWYLPYIFIFTPIPNASVIKVLTLSIIFPYLCPLSRFPPRYHPP